MELFEWQLVSIAVVALTIGNTCGGPIKDPNDTRRMTDGKICGLIDRMRRYLPSYISLDERCQRYTVLLSLCGGVPNESLVFRVATMDKSNLSNHYEEMSLHNRTALLMAAADRYRITNLAPSFLELVDCIRQIDQPSAQGYVEHDEIVVIENLYRQVLGLPGITIDLKNLNLNRFHPAFRATLGNLFRQYFDIDGMCDTSLAPVRRHPHKPMEPSGLASDPEEATRMLENIKQRIRYREHRLHQKRERSRLSNQRQRLLEPEIMHERYRAQQRRLRVRRRQQKHEKVLLSMIQGRGLDFDSQRSDAKRRRLQRRAEVEGYLKVSTNERPTQELPQEEYLSSDMQESSDPPSPTSQDYEASEHMHVTKETPQSVPIQFAVDPSTWSTRITTVSGPMDRFPFLITDDNETQSHQLIENLIRPTDTDKLDHDRIDSAPVQTSGPMSALQFFEPESQEEHDTHQDLIDHATQTDETEAVFQILSSQPQDQPVNSSVRSTSQAEGGG